MSALKKLLDSYRLPFTTEREKALSAPEAFSHDDFITYNGEQGAKEAGKFATQARNRLVKDGDVIHSRFNV